MLEPRRLLPLSWFNIRKGENTLCLGGQNDLKAPISGILRRRMFRNTESGGPVFSLVSLESEKSVFF